MGRADQGNVEQIGIVYNPEPGNSPSAFRKSIDEVANREGIVSIETPSGDSSDIDRLIHSLKDKPNSGLIFLPDAITLSDVFRLLRWLRSAGCRRSTRFAPSARRATSSRTG